jgi:hypothetical protein
MRRWPFACAAIIIFTLNMYRLSGNLTLRIWNDPTCAALFIGYMICIAIAVAIRTPTPPAGP